MKIDLPDQLIERATRLAGADEDAATVLAKALDRLEGEAAEVAAVQEGIDAYHAGDHRSLEEFGAELRTRLGVETPEA